MTGKIIKQMSTISKGQIAAINTIISKRGLNEVKMQMMLDASDGRTKSSKELTSEEAYNLLQFLNSSTEENETNDRMIKKLFAMAYDLGWIKQKSVVILGKLQSKKDYSAVYEWVEKYGYLKKPLRKYTYGELPKLLSQFEHGPYRHYLKK